MATIKNDDRPGGKLNEFDLADVYLLQNDLVEKRKSIKGGSNTQATIAEITTAASSTSASGKTLIGKTGAYLRWHESEEFVKLSKD